MPGFNGTGPRGMGPMTGGGRGFCNPNAAYSMPYGGVPRYGMGFSQPYFAGRGIGFGAGMGRGMGRGMGMGMGRGMAMGMGRGMAMGRGVPMYGAGAGMPMYGGRMPYGYNPYYGW